MEYSYCPSLCALLHRLRVLCFAQTDTMQVSPDVEHDKPIAQGPRRLIFDPRLDFKIALSFPWHL
jgi:hypothetical protein